MLSFVLNSSIKMEGVVSILGIFSPKQGQSFKTLYRI